MRTSLFFAAAIFLLTHAAPAATENLVFTIDEVKIYKEKIYFKAHYFKEKEKPRDCPVLEELNRFFEKEYPTGAEWFFDRPGFVALQKVLHKRVCTRDDIGEFKWFYDADCTHEMYGRTFEGPDFETAFRTVVDYVKNMSPTEEVGNFLCGWAQSKHCVAVPEDKGIFIRETDFPDKRSLRPEIVAAMNKRLNVKTDGQAVFVTVGYEKCTNLPEGASCFAALMLKHKDTPQKDYLVVVTSDKNIPLIFPDQSTAKVALEP